MVMLNAWHTLCACAGIWSEQLKKRIVQQICVGTRATCNEDTAEAGAFCGHSKPASCKSTRITISDFADNCHVPCDIDADCGDHYIVI